MVAEKLLFSSTEMFRVISVDRIENLANIYVISTRKNCYCPNCCAPARGVHSYYTRMFKDLPVFGNQTNIYLRARKFYCRESECPVKVFTERFDCHFYPYKRSTRRLEKSHLAMVLESGGKSAERLSRKLGMQVSDSTLLRLINREPVPACKVPKALGVDDWAYKKRNRYGTVLVNLENHRIINLLTDREAGTFEEWLNNNPGVEIISRDRYGKYIQGATKGAPDAQQVTDRWHLLKNLGEALRKLLDKEYNVLKSVRNELASEKSIQDADCTRPLILESTASDRQKEKFKAVKDLYAKGESLRSISRMFKMHRGTVKKYIEAESLPRRHYKMPTNLGKHLAYIQERLLKQPLLQMKDLWEELKSRGYVGAYSTLSEGLKYYGIKIGKKSKHIQIPNLPDTLWRPSKTCILFFKDPAKLSDSQSAMLKNLCRKSKN